MPHRIGYACAFEMFALGEPVDAHSALAWGLANRVESERFAERLQTVEAREAFSAFAERRPPDFLKLVKQPA
jgi:enoyl-CoA hydratase/carnithine racemase